MYSNLYPALQEIADHVNRARGEVTLTELDSASDKLQTLIAVVLDQTNPFDLLEEAA